MLLKEIHGGLFFEEQAEAIQVSKFWEDNKNQAKTYIARDVFYVKLGDHGKYDIYSVSPNEQKQKVDSLSKADLDIGYAKSSADQRPDAEGFQTYRSNRKITAIQNTEDDIILAVNGRSLPFPKDDFLIKRIQGSSFVYRILNDVKFKLEFRPN